MHRRVSVSRLRAEPPPAGRHAQPAGRGLRPARAPPRREHGRRGRPAAQASEPEPEQEQKTAAQLEKSESGPEQELEWESEQEQEQGPKSEQQQQQRQQQEQEQQLKLQQERQPKQQPKQKPEQQPEQRPEPQVVSVRRRGHHQGAAVHSAVPEPTGGRRTCADRPEADRTSAQLWYKHNDHGRQCDKNCIVTTDTQTDTDER